ncbi:MAG: hypothetical protein R3F65_32950 [bacterium]
MAEIGGYLLMILGTVNAVWFALWALIAWSGSVGAKMSKKVGTDNQHTDAAIEVSRDLGRQAIEKLTISAVLFGVGALLVYVIA